MLIEKTIEAFSEELKSKAATPGGGGVAALNSAMGAALIMMVANLTVSNRRYDDQNEYPGWQKLCSAALNKLEPIHTELLKSVDYDAEEFGKMARAYAMPKQTEAEKALRLEAVAEASKGAAQVPLNVMRLSVRALEICEALLGRSNPNLKSDLLVAAISLRAGVLSAKCNVDVNIPMLKKCDEHNAAAVADEAAALAEMASSIADRIK